MKNVLFYIITLTMITSCHVSQMSTFKGKYNRFLDSDEKEVITKYHNVTSKKPNGTFVFRQFFPETGQITHYFHYDKVTNQKNGPYQEWYDDGTLIAEGQYDDGKKVGTWYVNSMNGVYKDGKKEGEWKWINKKGQVEAVYNYINDQKEGKFIEYDSLGMVENEGLYRGDTIYNETRQKTIVTVKEVVPMMASCIQESLEERKACSDQTILQYVYRSLRYPRQDRENDVSGQAIAQFTIDKDGSVVDVKVIRGICQSIKDEVTRVITNMPPWNPGYQNDKPVRVLYTLPVKFKLE
ncbi:MAG TPA: TonB family protein [Saprospiraceae bacterium]|nr:TonB family protein [Saprospiraceae bacterium]